MTLLSTKFDIQTLLEHRDNYCISIYLPTYKAGPETQQNPIRLKNLLQEVRDKLNTQGLDKAAIEKLLKPAEELLENRESDFWQHQDSGLAIFIHENFFETYRLPLNFQSLAVISQRFYIKPLIPLVTENEHGYLLALSQNQVRLFELNRTNIHQLDLRDIPSSLAEALRFDQPEKQLQFHSGSDSGSQAIYHGHGVGTTDNKNEIWRYFQAIDNGLLSLLPVEDQIPLILAAVDYLIPLYHQVSSYPNILEEGIVGNPDSLLPQELHQKAGKILEKYVHQRQEAVIQDYQQKKGTGQASDRLSMILAAAYDGQVDTLLVAKNQQQWGQFDPKNYQLELHDQKTRNSDELLDIAAVQTLTQGGKVYLVDGDRLPENALMVATFRYPVVSGKTAMVNGE